MDNLVHNLSPIHTLFLDAEHNATVDRSSKPVSMVIFDSAGVQKLSYVSLDCNCLHHHQIYRDSTSAVRWKQVGKYAFNFYK